MATVVDQTTVEWVVQIALDAFDKPSEFRSAPEQSLARMLERYGTPVFEVALARVRELLALNERDFVAAGAERMLENVLAG